MLFCSHIWVFHDSTFLLKFHIKILIWIHCVSLLWISKLKLCSNVKWLNRNKLLLFCIILKSLTKFLFNWICLYWNIAYIKMTYLNTNKFIAETSVKRKFWIENFKYLLPVYCYFFINLYDYNKQFCNILNFNLFMTHGYGL